MNKAKFSIQREAEALTGTELLLAYDGSQGTERDELRTELLRRLDPPKTKRALPSLPAIPGTARAKKTP